MGKEDAVHIYDGIPLSHETEMMSFVTTWMDLQMSVLSVCKSDRERQIPYDFTHIWSLKNATNS